MTSKKKKKKNGNHEFLISQTLGMDLRFCKTAAPHFPHNSL